MNKDNFYKLYNDVEDINNIINEFHKLYYYSSCIGGTWKNTKWMGVPIQKCPMDMIIYQELIYSIRPDIIIETGTKVGGSALFFANICENKKVMVILDSDHSEDHVLKELNIYSGFVSVGSYLIVEDTNISNSPVYGIEGKGPLEAVFKFINNNDNFVIDKSKEKFYFTFNPNGYLLRL